MVVMKENRQAGTIKIADPRKRPRKRTCLFPLKAVNCFNINTDSPTGLNHINPNRECKMKRLSYAAAVCSIAVITTLFAVSAFGAAEKAASKPNTGMNRKENASGTMTGKVVETMNSGGYSYIRLEYKGKKTWFAAPQMAVTKGQVMTFELGMEMKNFTSKTLNRTFDSIYFSDGPIAANSEGANKVASSSHGAKNTAPAATNEKISVKKAAGKNAYTIAEVYAKKASLNEKPAVIRGKVVKVSSGIMGKNWVHLQDGTGDASNGANELIATTLDSPAVGDVVTVKGTIFTNKDFGAGYKYDVIMEKATIQR